VILGFPTVTVVSGFVALVILQLAGNAFLAHRIGRITFERLDTQAVMAGAEKLVQQFSGEGFTIIGGYRFSFGGKQVVLTMMLSPGRDRVAVVTDLVQYVVSRFGSRTLVTGTSGVAPLPPGVLRQVVAGGSPAELLRAHAAALTLLDRESLRPDAFATDDDALAAVRQHEEGAIAFIGQGSLKAALRMEVGHAATGVLIDDPDRQSRIDGWLKA
jgi:hypothetical protein